MEESRRQQILLVEDETKISDVLADYLESVGFSVHSETHGAEAIKFAATHQPDLVILDLQLPDIHGYEVCKVLRQQYHSWVLPILMLTGMDAPMDQLRGYAHGADAYVTKPLEPPELLPTIELLLGKTDPQ